MIFIGYIEDYNRPTGPANVLINLMEQYKKNGQQYKFINCFAKSKLEKIKVMLKISSLIFKRGETINIHSFGYKIPHFVLKISKLNKRNKYYLTLHGLMSEEAKYFSEQGAFEDYYRHKSEYDNLEKELVEQFPNIICISNKERKLIEEKFGRESNLFSVYNGINICEEVETEKGKGKNINEFLECVMAGGIYNIKGIFEDIHLINAFNNNNHSEIKARLHIYGGYESEELIEKFNGEVDRLGLKGYILYHGSVEHEELLKNVAKANLCLVLSKRDTFNLTALEAMSVGTPALVSIQSGVSEIIQDGDNGFLIDVKSDYIKEGIEKLNYLIMDGKQYNNICNNAKNTAKNYNWENIYKEYKKIFSL